jgi:hypothetical protein
VGEVVGKRTAQFARIWVRAKWDIACEGCEDSFAEGMVNECGSVGEGKGRVLRFGHRRAAHYLAARTPCQNRRIVAC